MLPIEMKEKIQNGTMRAFVSKYVEVNLGDKFKFVEKGKCITVFTDRNRGQTYTEVIAKAECVGVVKGSLEFEGWSTWFQTWAGEIGARDVDNNEINLLKVLGWDITQQSNALQYYQAMLGDNLEGYLHLFKLVESK